MKRILIGAALAALAATQVLAQSPTSHRATLGNVATVATPFALGAAFPATSTFSWTTIGTKIWTYPWTYKPFNFGSVVGQGVNATGQYISNVVNPQYFNETLKLTGPNSVFKPDAGAHNTTAQYKQQNSRTSKGPSGELIVGCIFGSALGTIAAAVHKAHSMGNPLRWRSQAEHERIVASGYEKQFELTNDEAAISGAVCGLGSVYVMAQRR